MILRKATLNIKIVDVEDLCDLFDRRSDLETALSIRNSDRLRRITRLLEVADLRDL